MAIGDTNNSNSGNKKLFENTYYSRLRFKSPDGKLALTPSFRSGLLIFDISELKEAEGFKYDSLISIYLSPTKARLFVEQIKRFKEYYASGEIIPGKAFGVNAGMGDKISFIGIHADADENILITIGKFDDSGNITDNATITLNCKEYHFSLMWDNIDTNDVGKCYNNMIEVNQIEELCTDFARNMSGAIGYAVADLTRFDLARVLGKMDPIYDKLGIERKSYGNGGNSNYNRGNSFLDNSKSVQSTHTSIDDIM